VGHRYPIQVTRALLSGVLHGNFDSIPFTKDSYFGLEVPTLCPGVEKEMLNPILAWHNHEDYRANASKLSSLFEANFKKFAGKVALDVCNAGPKPL
jgi:phosphoenolpyruvate carboxykinase (ATP)